MSKPIVADEPIYHYYGSTLYNWACGKTRAEVLKSLGIACGDSILKQAVKSQHGGLYAYTVRVLLPQSAPYEINYFRPVLKPELLEEAQECLIVNRKGHCVPTD